MADIFIAHIEKDWDVALEITLGLEKAGYSTWCYEADNIPGPSYLIQTGRAIELAKTVVVIISPHSIGSRQVTKEIVHAHEAGKEFIPVRRNISHIEFQNRQPEWREAIGAASSIEITPAGMEDVIARIVGGLKAMGIYPSQSVDPNRIERLHKVLANLREYTAAEKADMVEVPPEPPKERVTAPKVLPTKIPEKTGKGRKRIIVTAIAAAVVIVAAIIVVLLSGWFVHYSLTVISNPADGGTVVPSGGTYDADAKVTLIAIPTQGYTFDKWSGDINGEATSAAVVMDGDKSVTAHFKVQYTLNVSVSPPGGGTVEPAGGTYDADARVTLTAVPAQGYAFDRWSGDISGGTSYITVSMDNKKNITALFKAQYTLNTEISPPGGGTVEPAGGTYDADTRVTLKAIPAPGYAFDKWGGDISGETSSVTVSMNNKKNITAYFKVQYTLNTSVSPAGGGTVTPAGGNYDVGASVTLTATPASGYIFDRWSGDVTDESTSVTVVMDMGKSVTAHFNKILFEDDFNNPDSGWYIATSESGVWAYEDGEYSLFVKKSNYWIHGDNKNVDYPNDFAVEVDIRKLSQGNGEYGALHFRAKYQDGKHYFYQFEIDPSTRMYKINKCIGGEWTDLRGWTSSSYIKGDTSTNRLKVICKGTQIEVYVNNYKLATINDASLAAGFVAMTASSQDPGSHYHFDNFRMWAITD